MERHTGVPGDHGTCFRCGRFLGGTRIDFEVGVDRPRSATSREHRLGEYTKGDRFQVLDRRTVFLCHPCRRRLLLRAVVSGEGAPRLGFGAMLLVFVTLSVVLGVLDLGGVRSVFEWALLFAFGGSLLLYRHLKGDPRALVQLALAVQRAELAETFGVKARALRVRVPMKPEGLVR